ncbi:MAG TPA: ATP-binding cassette domain-containing protein [Thermodesulfobacteriota bacterium]|nr:ATP-binding cassette domain-containing protein [Thermodesulfobacteriota bacterium]
MTKQMLLQAKSISKEFGSGHTKVIAVNNVSMDVQAGELVLIMGPSGSGKTTLLSILGTLLKPTNGEVFIDGINTTSMNEAELPNTRAHKVGFVFQAFNLLEALNVEENILFPAQLIPDKIKDAKARCDELIDRLNLTERHHALPKTLSGGEKQRVAIARALINKPKLILADEPTGNLDSQSGQDVMMILHDITRDEECAILLVTHDPRVEDIADRILWLEDGKLRDRRSEQHHWVKDPVCGMRVDEWTAVSFTEYKDNRYVFCSKRCLERFLDNPGKYHKHESS